MTNVQLAKNYLETAVAILKEAERLHESGTWHLVVRRSQECVELCLKALLRQAGIEIPHLHDVGTLFWKYQDRFPGLDMQRLIAASRRLTKDRELSFYGDEETETPPDILFSEKDAADALNDARWILSLIK